MQRAKPSEVPAWKIIWPPCERGPGWLAGRPQKNASQAQPLDDIK